MRLRVVPGQLFVALCSLLVSSIPSPAEALSQAPAAAAADIRAFGALGDCQHDDAPAIRSALATGRALLIPKASGPCYLLKSYGDTVFSDTRFMFVLGDNARIDFQAGAKLRVADETLSPDFASARRGGAIFLSVGRKNILVRGQGELDMNGGNNLVSGTSLRGSYAFLMHNCTDCAIEDVTVRDNPGLNNFVFGGGGGGTRNLVQHTVSINGGTTLPGNTKQVDFSAIYIDSSDSRALENTVLHDHDPRTYNSGIELHGSGSQAIGNRIQRAYPGIYFANDGPIDSNSGGYTIADNVFEEVLIAIMPAGKGNLENVAITNNRATTRQMSGPLASVASYFFLQPRDDAGKFTYSLILRNVRIEGNTLIDLDPAPQRDRSSFIKLSATDGVVVRQNVAEDLSGTPFIVVGSPFGTRGLTISENRVSCYGRNPGPFGHAAFNLDWRGSSTSPRKLNYDADGVTIRGNVIVPAPTGQPAYAYFVERGPGSSLRNLTAEGNVFGGGGIELQHPGGWPGGIRPLDQLQPGLQAADGEACATRSGARR